ncbi:MAG: hypothetical protein COA70_03680 [Planctomycetota bacterium]|nr:MAG: hypothetical protein COA70_03680 [Planctomycetota bacterium]
MQSIRYMISGFPGIAVTVRGAAATLVGVTARNTGLISKVGGFFIPASFWTITMPGSAAV